MNGTLSLPPLLSGRATAGEPFADACAAAAAGCDAGLILHGVAEDTLSAALVLAPEVPLEDACAMRIAAGLGIANALGALAPPEVAVHLGWDGAVRVNGGRAGRLRLAAAPREPAAVPGWLVVGLDLAFAPPAEDGGEEPERTALWAEGCGDVAPLPLLEAWARHSLYWIHRWEEDGARPLHAEWRGLAWGVGEEIAAPDGSRGTFLGVDERFGLLLKSDGETRLIPLSATLEDAP